MLLQYNQSPDAKAVVIYHANCMDGFAAAWAFKRLAAWRYGGGVRYGAVNYGDAELIYQDFVTQDVFVVDFSFSREVLRRLSAVARTVTVLDHHKTAAEELQNWTDCPSNLAIIFDMNRSGAGITWDFCKDWNHLYNNAPIDFNNSRSGLVNWVEDRDLWRFKLPNSREVNAYIATVDFRFDSYDELYNDLRDNYERIVDIGEVLEKQHLKIASQIAEHASEHINTDGVAEYKGLEVNCPPQFASEVGHILATRSGTFGLCYWIDAKDVLHSSIRGCGTVDVSAIAKFHGGGGHKNAAGWKSNPDEYTIGGRDYQHD